jgi:uracil-DNA glycosylase family 4
MCREHHRDDEPDGGEESLGPAQAEQLRYLPGGECMDPEEAWRSLTQEIEGCRRCPRLVAYREEVARVKRRAYRQEVYWGRPVPGFGDRQARLILVGLAPAAHGANRTGRMFTGDRSGDFLFAALHRAGFANRPESRHKDDGLTLQDAYIFSIVRCVPPDNRPTPAEVAACAAFLRRELALLREARVVLCLGKLAWDVVRRELSGLGAPVSRVAFAHAAEDFLPPPWPVLLASYHPSQQNTQTGRLTPAMLDAVLARARAHLHRPGGAGSVSDPA